MAEKGALLVGLTGGIGSGKSKVASLLEELGAAVDCSDRIVRELQSPGAPGLRAIVEAFGEEYLTASGELDRPKLGKLVFEDAEARQRLNRLIHPLVTAEHQRRAAAHRARGVEVIVADVPLLLEGRKAGVGTGALLPFDLIALVYARPEQQLERVVARDKLAPADARARIAAQLPIDEKRALADVVIDNSGDWEATAKQVRGLYSQWVERARLTP
ncbi:MAG TPA: dephospho-CoA kinase [Myxococcota bacterium]|nr:dephospho-CoA kinase [Myxococcota bacterium]